MIGIDAGERRDDTGESPSATQSRLAALAAEVALRDRELTLLRDTLDAERAQARAARLLTEEHLKEIEHATHVQEQLEQAANEMRSAYSDLRMQHDRVAVELDAARNQALERAARAEAMCAAAEAGRLQAERERVTAVELARDAERAREADGSRLGAEIERVTAELAAATQRAEQERRDAAAVAAEALTALAAAEYRRRTRYEHAIGELKSAHAAALEQAVRAEAARSASAALCQRLERERDELAAKVAEAHTLVARSEDRIGALLDGDAAHRTELDTLRAQLVVRERDIEAAQLAEQSVLEILTGVRARLAEQEVELAAARARAAELDARWAATEHEDAALRAAVEELAAARDDVRAALAAECAQRRAQEETSAALRATLATREADVAALRDACAAAQRARVEAEEAAAQWAQRYRVLADAQARELDAVRAELAAEARAHATTRAQLHAVDAAHMAAVQQAAALSATQSVGAGELEEARAANAAFAAELDAARAEWMVVQDEHVAMHEQLHQLDAARAAAEHRVQELYAAHASIVRDAEQARAAQATLAAELDAARAEWTVVQDEHTALREQVDQLEEARAAADARAVSLHAGHAAAARELAGTRAAHAALMEELGAARQAAAEAAHARARLADLERETAERDGAVRALEATLAQLENDRAAHALALCEAARQGELRAAQLQDELAARLRERDDLHAVLNQTRSALQNAAAEGVAQRGEIQVLRGQLIALEDLPRLRARCDTAEAARRTAEADAQRWREASDERAAAAGRLNARIAQLDEQLQAVKDAETHLSDALRERADQAQAAHNALAHERAERERLLEELAETRQALGERGEEQGRVNARIAQLEEDLRAARAAETRLADALREGADQEQAAQQALERERAERSRLSDELADTQQALDACRRASHEHADRVAAAEQAEQATAAQYAQLLQQARLSRDQLLENEARLVAIGGDLEREQRERAALQEAFDELQTSSEQERAAATAARARAAAAEAERDELRRRADELSLGLGVRPGESDAGREPLAADGDEPDHRRVTDAAGLTPVDTDDGQQPESSLTDASTARLTILENQRLREQLRALEAACAPDGGDGLARLQRHRDGLDQRFRAPDGIAAQPLVGESPQNGAATMDRVGVLDNLTAARRRKSSRGTLAARTADPSVGEQMAEPAIILEAGEELTVVHVEHHGPLRDALRAAVEQCRCARYAALQDIPPGAEGSRHLLAVNLLARDIDPVSTICDPRWGEREARAFIYLAAGERGIVAGLTDFIPYPLDANDCATRLLERTGGLQRLLMVSDKIDAMNEIRSVLNRVDCSTSLALDDRQGLNLVGMVKPDAILIDLTLPRAGGIRLLTRLRADAATAGIAMIFALGERFDADRFQEEAGRVLGECRLNDEELSGALARVLGDVHVAEARAATA